MQPGPTSRLGVRGSWNRLQPSMSKHLLKQQIILHRIADLALADVEIAGWSHNLVLERLYCLFIERHDDMG